MGYIEISKSDWKLYREKLPGWQEAYMGKLCEEYAAILSSCDSDAADKFWTLEKRIREDKRKPGVLIEIRRSTVFFDIARLIGDGVITLADLSEFSPELRKVEKLLIGADDE